MSEPKAYLVGFTQIHYEGLREYLKDTDQLAFIEYLDDAIKAGVSSAEALVSFYAKLCYKSLVLGKNENVKKIRGITDNLEATLEHKHGSVFEHAELNFVFSNVSRVFTHELVRHRTGTAFSQESGRYVSLGNIEIVLPPELKGDYQVMQRHDKYLKSVMEHCAWLRNYLIRDDTSFADKKKLTSAIRRYAPIGLANTIGFSCNIRSLRHIIDMRTSPHAEWEIRLIFNQVAKLIEKRFPYIMYGGEVEVGEDGLNWYKDLRI